MRTVVNLAADGSSIKLADPAAEITEWQLEYAGLTDERTGGAAAVLPGGGRHAERVHVCGSGGNLLAWSEQLDNAAWSAGPLLTATAAQRRARWHLANSGAAAQSITQTLAAPGGYVYCFSVYVRAAQPTAVTLLAGAERSSVTVGSAVAAVHVHGQRATQRRRPLTFGLEAAGRGAVDAYGVPGGSAGGGLGVQRRRPRAEFTRTRGWRTMRSPSQRQTSTAIRRR